MTPHPKSPEVSEGYLRASSWWTPIIWGMGISGFLGLVVIAVILLEQKHLIPKWVFAWISNDRITQKRQFVRMLCGLLALWFGARLLKIGFFGNTARTIYTGVLSKLKFSQGHPDEWTHEQICAVRNVRSALFLAGFFTVEVFLSWRALGKPFLEHSLYNLLFRIVLSILVFPVVLNIAKCISERFILAIVTIRIVTGWVIEFVPNIAASAAGLVRQTNLVLWILALLATITMLISSFASSGSARDGSQPNQADFTVDR